MPAYIYLSFFEFDDQAYSLLLTFEPSQLLHTDEDNEPGGVLFSPLDDPSSVCESPQRPET